MIYGPTGADPEVLASVNAVFDQVSKVVTGPDEQHRKITIWKKSTGTWNTMCTVLDIMPAFFYDSRRMFTAIAHRMSPPQSWHRLNLPNKVSLTTVPRMITIKNQVFIATTYIKKHKWVTVNIYFFSPKVGNKRNIHSQHHCETYDRGKSLPESHRCYIPLPRKSHWQRWRFNLLFAIFFLVSCFKFWVTPYFISFAVADFQAETDKCESVKNSEEEEAKTCAKGRGGRSYEM